MYMMYTPLAQAPSEDTYSINTDEQPESPVPTPTLPGGSPPLAQPSLPHTTPPPLPQRFPIPQTGPMVAPVPRSPSPPSGSPGPSSPPQGQSAPPLPQPVTPSVGPLRVALVLRPPAEEPSPQPSASGREQASQSPSSQADSRQPGEAPPAWYPGGGQAPQSAQPSGTTLRGGVQEKHGADPPSYAPPVFVPPQGVSKNVNRTPPPTAPVGATFGHGDYDGHGFDIEIPDDVPLNKYKEGDLAAAGPQDRYCTRFGGYFEQKWTPPSPGIPGSPGVFRVTKLYVENNPNPIAVNVRVSLLKQ